MMQVWQSKDAVQGYQGIDDASCHSVTDTMNAITADMVQMISMVVNMVLPLSCHVFEYVARWWIEPATLDVV